MAWINTGFRRTLKLKITKTEINNYYNPQDFIIDGNVSDFTGSTAYDWGTGLTMGQASSTQFDDRIAQTQIFVESNFPYSAYSGITWANTRIGANAHIDFVINPSDGEQFKIVLYDDNTSLPINAIETVRIRVDYVYSNNEAPDQSGTTYFYINNGDSETEYIQSSNGFNCLVGELDSLYSNTGTYIENVDYISPAPYSIGPNGTLIDKQYNYTAVNFGQLDPNAQ
jgi:hypothetical protein